MRNWIVRSSEDAGDGEEILTTATWRLAGLEGVGSSKDLDVKTCAVECGSVHSARETWMMHHEDLDNEVLYRGTARTAIL